MKTLLSITLTAIVAFLTAIFLSGETTQPIQPFNPTKAKYVLVQFNASWHTSPSIVGLENIKWCDYQPIDISRTPALKAKHKISTLPTVIFFKDGVEVKRWEAGVAMKATFTAQQISAEIQRLR